MTEDEMTRIRKYTMLIGLANGDCSTLTPVESNDLTALLKKQQAENDSNLRKKAN
jgi:hypothetical protein